MSRRWTNKELGQLDELRANSISVVEIATVLGRTIPSVKGGIAYYRAKRKPKYNRRILVNLNDSLLEQAHKARGGMTLSEWVRRQIERALREGGK